MRLIDADAMILRYQSHPNRHSKTDLNISYEEILDAIVYDLERESTITLKEYAKAEGYSIIKKKPMPKLKPCPQCGASGRKIEEWVCRTGYFYICSECNHQSNPARSERKARGNWNETN